MNAKFASNVMVAVVVLSLSVASAHSPPESQRTKYNSNPGWVFLKDDPGEAQGHAQSASAQRPEMAKEMIYFDAGLLSRVKSAIAARNPYFLARYKQLMAESKSLLSNDADPVVNKTVIPPSGDVHDYISFAPYRWPDETKPGGLPWKAIDGVINPVSRGADTDYVRLGRFSAAVEKLSFAYYFSGDTEYSDKGVELLRIWFVDPATRVNPNLNYGQGVPGIADGRPAGVIEWARISKVVTALQVFDHGGVLPADMKAEMHAWMNQYLDWLLTSKLGKEAAALPQNHGSHYSYQVIGLMIYLGRVDDAKSKVEAAKASRIAAQIQPDGRQPLETGRTKSLHYSTMNLWALANVAYMGRQVGVDFWRYETEDGRSLRQAYRFLEPYVLEQEVWPYKQITNGGASEVIRLELKPMFGMSETLLGVKLLDQKLDSAPFLTALQALQYPPLEKLPALGSSQDYQVHVESGGLVAMEVESSSSPLGHWIQKTTIEGFTGNGYLEFSGNEPSSGPASSPLEYSFKVSQSGLYYLHLRCARQAVGDRKDWANDCYVRIEGDYGSGPNAGHRHGKDATLSVLKGDTKFYGGELDQFSWSAGARLDPGGKTNKRVAVYNFRANQEYKLVISGRSQFFKLDRVVLRHIDVAEEVAESKELPESKQVTQTRTGSRPVAAGGPPAGRLAIVTDGNAWDPDDVCASPVSLALLRAAGMEKRLVHFCHSCELKNKPIYAASGGEEEEILRRQMNQLSCDTTASRWGGFDHITFWNCRTQRSEVVAELLATLNASTAEDPLWIIEAGEPDVIYEAAEDAKPGVMQHVFIITHHPNNDRGVFHHLDDLLTIQSPGARVLRIPDQNKNLKNPLSHWHWARDHADPKINWLWERGEFAANRAFGDPKFAYKPIKGKFDASDAGMTLYWLTGAYPNGLQQGTPTDVQNVLNNPVEDPGIGPSRE